MWSKKGMPVWSDALPEPSRSNFTARRVSVVSRLISARRLFMPPFKQSCAAKQTSKQAKRILLLLLPMAVSRISAIVLFSRVKGCLFARLAMQPSPSRPSMDDLEGMVRGTTVAFCAYLHDGAAARVDFNGSH